MGTERIAPGTPHMAYQKARESKTTMGWSSSFSPNTVGSIRLPTTRCTKTGKRKAKSFESSFNSGSRMITGRGKQEAIMAPKLGMKFMMKVRKAKRKAMGTWNTMFRIMYTESPSRVIQVVKVIRIMRVIWVVLSIRVENIPVIKVQKCV